MINLLINILRLKGNNTKMSNNLTELLYCMRRYIPKTGKTYDLRIMTNDNNYQNYTFYQSDIELFDYMLNYIKYNVNTNKIDIVYSEPEIMIDLIEMYLAIKCDTPYDMKDIYMAYKYLSPKTSFYLTIKMLSIYDHEEIDTLINIMDDVDIALHLIYNVRAKNMYTINNKIITRKNTILSLPDNIFNTLQKDARAKFLDKQKSIKDKNKKKVLGLVKNNIQILLNYLFDKLNQEKRFFELNQLLCSFSRKFRYEEAIEKVNLEECKKYCGFRLLNLDTNSDDTDILDYFINMHKTYSTTFLYIILYLYELKNPELTNKFLNLTLDDYEPKSENFNILTNILQKNLLLKHKYTLISKFLNDENANIKKYIKYIKYIKFDELEKNDIKLNEDICQIIICKSIYTYKDILCYIDYLLYPLLNIIAPLSEISIKLNENQFMNYLLSEPDFFSKYTFSFLKRCECVEEYCKYNIVYSGNNNLIQLQKMDSFNIDSDIYNNYCKLDITNINKNMLVSNNNLYIQNCGKCIFENVHSCYKFIFDNCSFLLVKTNQKEIIFIAHNDTITQYNSCEYILPCLLTKNFIIDFLCFFGNNKIKSTNECKEVCVEESDYEEY